MHCATCRGEHNMMAICPGRPPAHALIRAWWDGDRSDPMSWIAVIGCTVILTLNVIMILTLIGV